MCKRLNNKHDSMIALDRSLVRFCTLTSIKIWCQSIKWSMSYRIYIKIRSNSIVGQLYSRDLSNLPLLVLHFYRAARSRDRMCPPPQPPAEPQAARGEPQHHAHQLWLHCQHLPEPGQPAGPERVGARRPGRHHLWRYRRRGRRRGGGRGGQSRVRQQHRKSQIETIRLARCS